MRSATASLRGNVDLYTGLCVDELASPQVDHIVETQFVARAAATAIGVNGAFRVAAALKAALNPEDCSNYNVTSRAVNVKKGHAFTAFLKGGMYSNEGIGSIAVGIGMNVRDVARLQRALLDHSCNTRDIIEGWRPKGVVPTGEGFLIADELDIMFEAMKLDNEVRYSRRAAHK
jgi:hypothetical protein